MKQQAMSGANEWARGVYAVGGVSWRSVGLQRAVAAAPAIVASTLLVAAVLSTMPAAGTAAMTAWLAIAVGLSTRVGERVAVRAWCRFRGPTTAQRRLLAGLCGEAARHALLDDSQIDWYIVQESSANAYVAGGHSIAVTSGLLDAYLTGRMPRRHLTAVLVHELGHVVTGGARYGLMIDWLAFPFRLAAQLLFFGPARLLGYSGTRQPVLVVVVGAGLVAAIARGTAQHAWFGAAALASAALFAVATPIASAAVSRRAERAADAFAAQLGVAADLEEAIRSLGGQQGSGWSLLRRHPDKAERSAVLLAAAEQRRRVVQLDQARQRSR